MEEGRPKLSAGRVQSVATRAHRGARATAWRSSAVLGHILAKLDASVSRPDAAPPTFSMAAVAGRRVATGRDFAHAGRAAQRQKSLCSTRSAAVGRGLDGTQLTVASTGEATRPYHVHDLPLQQEASRKLRFSAERT